MIQKVERRRAEPRVPDCVHVLCVEFTRALSRSWGSVCPVGVMDLLYALITDMCCARAVSGTRCGARGARRGTFLQVCTRGKEERERDE